MSRCPVLEARPQAQLLAIKSGGPTLPAFAAEEKPAYTCHTGLEDSSKGMNLNSFTLVWQNILLCTI